MFRNGTIPHGRWRFNFGLKRNPQVFQQNNSLDKLLETKHYSEPGLTQFPVQLFVVNYKMLQNMYIILEKAMKGILGD